MSKYKVLWFDDEHESLELIKDEALQNDIKLVGFNNAVDGLKELTEENYKKYDAVIVDGFFFVDEDYEGSTENNIAFGEVANALGRLKAKNIIIPWFILSGQPNFQKDDSNIVKLLADKDFAEGKIFNKNIDSDYQELFDAIKKYAHQSEFTQIRHNHKRVFQVCTDAYLGKDTEQIILDALSIVYYKYTQHSKNTKELFTPLRKGIIERLFKRLYELSIIPDDVFNNQGWINKSFKFLTGIHPEYELKEQILPATITSLFTSALNITQDASHMEGNLKLEIDEHISNYKTPYLYKSVVFQLLEILIWFKNFVDDHQDIDKNKSLYIKKEPHNQVLYKGLIEQDANGNYYCGEYLLNYKYIEANYKLGDEIEILESSLNNNPRTNIYYQKYANSCRKYENKYN